MNLLSSLINKVTLSITLLSLPFFSIGQSIVPKDGTIMHNDKKRACLVVNVDPEPKPLKEAWRKYMKDNYDVKLKGIGFLQNKDLLSATGVVVKEISSNTLDFYTEVLEDDNGSQMKVFVAFGYDIYINKESKPKEYDTLNSILKNFLRDYLPKYYEKKIKSTEKRIGVLSKEIAKANNEIKDDKKSIEKLNKKIEKLTEEISTNEKEVETAKKKLEGRENKLNRIKKQLKDL